MNERLLLGLTTLIYKTLKKDEKLMQFSKGVYTQAPTSADLPYLIFSLDAIDPSLTFQDSLEEFIAVDPPYTRFSKAETSITYIDQGHSMVNMIKAMQRVSLLLEGGVLPLAYPENVPFGCVIFRSKASKFTAPPDKKFHCSTLVFQVLLRF